MKNHILFLLVFGVIAFGAIEASAQCDPRSMSQVRCGYYNEGYQDGAADAQSSRASDYRRYRNKYNRTYENDFRDGYTAGYNSISYGGGQFPGSVRWNNTQRNAYNAGYNIGQNDRGRARRTENYGGYEASLGQYFELGYRDGFEGRQRIYDQPVTGGYYPTPGYPTPGYPTPGTGGINTASWGGRVDDRVNIIIRGSQIRTEDASGTGVRVAYQNINGSLPRRGNTLVTARKTNGRGNVSVIQQPARFNDFTAIVQIRDDGRADDDYRVEISWDGGGFGGGDQGPIIDDPYRSGSVRWTGRVDQTANIIIQGNNVQTEDASGTGISNVNFSINGILVRRSGSVTVRKRSGRGNVRVLEQPSRINNFTAVIQIFDPGSGADNYDIEISW